MMEMRNRGSVSGAARAYHGGLTYTFSNEVVLVTHHVVVLAETSTIWCGSLDMKADKPMKGEL